VAVRSIDARPLPMSCLDGIFRCFRHRAGVVQARVVLATSSDVRRAQTAATSVTRACCGDIDTCVGAAVHKVARSFCEISEYAAWIVGSRPREVVAARRGRLVQNRRYMKSEPRGSGQARLGAARRGVALAPWEKVRRHRTAWRDRQKPALACFLSRRRRRCKYVYRSAKQVFDETLKATQGMLASGLSSFSCTFRGWSERALCALQCLSARASNKYMQHLLPTDDARQTYGEAAAMTQTRERSCGSSPARLLGRTKLVQRRGPKVAEVRKRRDNAGVQELCAGDRWSERAM
jgi:hypothetical protein